MEIYGRAYRLIIYALFTGLVIASASHCQAASGGITGKILDAETLTPLPAATVVVIDQFAGTAADDKGTFKLGNLPDGEYRLQVSHIGYITRQITGIMVIDGRMVDLEIHLVPRPITLKTITVSPGQFNIMGTEPAVRQSLTQRELRTMPQLGDDFFRAVNRLPGVSGNDYSTRFTIRGGEFEEVLVTLDGLQIYEPFHMKDIDGGAMSIIDVAAVRSLELITGGFPANYGDKMSGVLDIRSRSVPPDEQRISVGASMINVRALAEGTFNENRGSWLASARRGYIDYVLHLADPDTQIKPTYYDLFGKLQYQLSGNHVLSLDFLHAGDALSLDGKDNDAGDTLRTEYNNSYLWLNSLSEPYHKVTLETVVAAGWVNHERNGQEEHEHNVHFTNDVESFNFVELKSDGEYEASRDVIVKFGADLRRLWADYDYLSRKFFYEYHSLPGGGQWILTGIDTVFSQLGRSGNKFGAYLSNRVRLDQGLVAEIGLRYDHASYSGDNLFSPRANLVYELDEQTTIRGGWGHYYQTEGMDEISAVDGETEYYPAQKAEHRMIGLEHEYASGINLRLEAYNKKYSRLRPVYRNSFEDIVMFPEREVDRTLVYREAADSRGIEIYLKKDTGGKFSWWMTYAYAKVEDSVRYLYFPAEDAMQIYQGMIPTPNDQRHTFYADVQYRPSPRWLCAMAFQYHSGWPYTGIEVVSYTTAEGTFYGTERGEPWGERYDSFQRLDLRVNRYFPLSRGRITAFIEALNVLGQKNVRSYDYSFYGGPEGPVLLKEPNYWLGVIPSFGVAYEIEF